MNNFRSGNQGRAHHEGTTQYKPIGIAFLVEERGKEARLLFRYPVSRLPSGGGDDVFYTLPPKTMVKLFRPKPSLCDRSTTISVGNTLFCCRAVLLDEENTIAPGEDDIDSSTTDQKIDSRQNKNAIKRESVDIDLVIFNVIIALKRFGSHSEMPGMRMSADHRSPSSAIQNIHLTLERVCHAFKREEKRSNFVSHQVSIAQKIIDESKDCVLYDDGDFDSEEMIERAQVRFGALLTSNASNLYNQGNLVRELSDCFHAICSYDDVDKDPNESFTNVSNKHSIVFVNGHVAVPISACGQSLHLSSQRILPYHTLFFREQPKLSAERTPKPLHKILRVAVPTKSLGEIALEASLSVPATIELSALIVQSGAALVAPKISLRSRYACNHNAMERMKKLALEFTQRFNFTIYRAVAILTTGQTLGCILLNKELKLNRFSTASQFVAGTFENDNDTFIFDMVAWLRSHEAIVELIDFVAATSTFKNFLKADNQSNDDFTLSQLQRISIGKAIVRDNLSLFNELLRLNLLSGSFSIHAIRWRTRIDSVRFNTFLDWGTGSNKVAVVTRVPSEHDEI